jgi:hypothetical protein
MEKASHSRNKTPNNPMALAAIRAITGISSQSFCIASLDELS